LTVTGQRSKIVSSSAEDRPELLVLDAAADQRRSES
jgi:hypothetical protein